MRSMSSATATCFAVRATADVPADRWYRRQVPAFAIRVRLAMLTGGPLVPAVLSVNRPSTGANE